MFNRSYRPRHGGRTSLKAPAQDSAKDQLHAQIMHCLHQPQLDRWNKELERISCRNLALHNRSNNSLHNKSNNYTYAIYFEGRNYSPKALYPLDDNTTEFVIVLHPDLYDEMQLVAHQLDRLDRERYAIGRFVSGLLTLGVNEEQFEGILGDNVLSACSRNLLNQCLDLSGTQPKAQELSIKNYVKENQDIVDLIGERRLINLVIS